MSFMKILVVCYMGMNRSRYLADFLREKGCDADCAGILTETKNQVTQERVDQSDMLVFVLPRIKEKFLDRFSVDTQRIITLDVEDRIDILCPDAGDFTFEEKQTIYKQFVYPKLEKQIANYFP